MCSWYYGPDIFKAPDIQPNTSVLTILQEALKVNGEHVALVDGDTTDYITSVQLFQKSISIATGLQRLGVSPGDVVVICSDKSILAFSLLLGMMFTGATTVLVPSTRGNVIDRLTGGETIKALFYHSSCSDTVFQSLARMTPPPMLIGRVEPADPIIATTIQYPQEFKMFQVLDVTRHVPLIAFTSGSTGPQKGVEISDLAIQLLGVQYTHQLQTVLITSPLHWMSTVGPFVNSVMKKCSLIFTNSTDAKHTLRICQKYRVDSFVVGMFMTKYIFEASIHQYDLSSLHGVSIGGELMLPSVVRTFATNVLKSGATFNNIYSTTETGLIASLIGQKVDNLQLGAVGKAVAGVQIKIIDDTGYVVPFGTIGRIWVKTPAAKGYWHSEDHNISFLDSEGFYDTGDAGVMDREGNLHLRGRDCEILEYTGLRQSPGFVEDLLMAHPAIMEVVVVGKPNPVDVHHPAAFVVLRPECKGTVTERDIEAYVNARVEDSMKLRGGVHILEILPRLANGKVFRKMLSIFSIPDLVNT